MPMHTEVCIGIDIAHFPSLMYGFIMQQLTVIDSNYTHSLINFTALCHVRVSSNDSANELSTALWKHCVSWTRANTDTGGTTQWSK